MTDRTTTLHALAAIALATALFIPATATAEEQWVRIQHRSDLKALDEPALRGELEDYGSFQWGRLDRSQVRALRARGLSVIVQPAPFELVLGDRRFDPLDQTIGSTERAPDPEGDFYLVQFEGPVRPDWLRALRATGARVVQPLHPFSYIVWASETSARAAASVPRVRWSGAMRAEWKHRSDDARAASGVKRTMLLASAHVPMNALREQLAAYGRVRSISALNAHFRVVDMEADVQDYSKLADLAAVYTVQDIPAEAGPRGEMSNQSIVGGIDNSNIVQPGYATWLGTTGYDGNGITVGVVDGRVLTTHQDLADRIVPCTGTNGSCGGSGSDSHGTHVAGAIAGTGASGALLGGFLRGQGVAPGASIVTQRYQPFLDGNGPGSMVPDGMLQIYQDAARSGALLTNNSWGPTTSPQGYDIPTQQIDFISRDADPDTPGDQPVLAVWSIMNGNGDAGGSCAPSSLGSPDEAKNLFAVGSTALQSAGGSQLSDLFSISSNSAHGPACDGRRVPHIVAPGCRTDSTSNGSDTDHGLNCGTSMASPVVSGAVAVWAEKYVGENGIAPSPALVKAVFTAAARDLEGETNADGGVMGHRPDRFQGYGRIDLDTVMNHGVEVFLHDQETIFDAVGQDWTLPLNAVDPGQPIRIMLAWTDAPGHGLGGSAPAWVNDLDLSVTAGGSTYLGNVIGADGWSEPGGSADDRNNLEGVFLAPAQHGGAVSIEVAASALGGDALNPYDPGDPSQDFALACYNCIVGDPTYTITPVPETLEACIPESGSNPVDIDVEIGTLGVYSGTVVLGASGEPAGVGSSFAPTSVPAPGSSVWTLDVADSALPGNATLTLQGDDGTDQHTADLALTLDDAIVTAPELQSPADAATDLPLTPTFEWSTLAEIASYRIQIATDSGFGNVVVDETIASDTFSPASDLALGAEYFWRVQGSNVCGGGTWSPTRSFTTRLEPEANFSQAAFAFSLEADAIAGATLAIENTGTGNLTWEVAADSPEALAGGGHEPARDEVVSIADFTLPGSGSNSATADAGVTSDGPVVGFSFQGTVSGISGTQTYASDMAMTITSPAGASYTVGGFNSPNDADWEFQGEGSTSDGIYTSAHPGPDIFGAEGTEDDGSWSFDFEHTWQDAMSWSNVTVTLHKMAPPFCEAPLAAPAWLSAAPASGSVGEGLTEDLTISVDSSGMTTGNYVGYLCITTNDQNAPLTAIEVELEVIESLFDDRFEQPAN
jgi:hypothetical protein